MFCHYSEDPVDLSTCEECNESYECEEREQLQHDEAQKKLRESEFGKAMLETLGKLVGIKDDRVDHAMKHFVEQAFIATKNQLKECIRKAAEVEATKYIETRAKSMLDQVFEEAVAEKTLFLQKDDLTVTKSVQKIVMDRVRNFFANIDSRGRKAINDSLEKLIQESVNTKVDEAIEEIKKEAIEKFNKEAMKKMMQGMAKSLGQDKRLLTMLCNEE